jgi:hypothetical protein
MIGSILKDTKILKCMDSQAAGTSDPTSDIVDTKGFNGACFIIKLGTVTDAGLINVKAYGDADSAMGSPTELSGAAAGIAITATDSEQVLVIDIVKPRERYIRLTAVRDTQNSEIDSIVCILYNPVKMPVTQPITIDASAQVVSPASV